MTISEFMYILTLSFQISGSLVLLLHFVSAKRNDVIYGFIGKGFITYNESERKLGYSHEDFANYYRAIWLNKFAFLYILIAYILNFFISNKSVDIKWYYFFILIFLTVSLLVVAYLISKLIANKDYLKEITIEELKELGINPHIETATNKDIDGMFIKKEEINI